MGLDQSPEVSLVRQAQGGDRTAYEQLIRQYARLVWAAIYGISRDVAGTEDLVQETFIKAWQALKSLREPEKFRGWLLTIARRKALQQNQARTREDEVLEDFALNQNDSGHAASPAGETDTPEETEDLRQQLHRALRELPEKYRLPLTLRYLEGCNYKEICATLDLTDGILRGLLHRGMKELRGKMQVASSER